MSGFLDEANKWSPLFIAVALPIASYFGRKLLHTIKKLVNDRLDAALQRITDLETLVKTLQALQKIHNGNPRDVGSTAESLRSPTEIKGA